MSFLKKVVSGVSNAVSGAVHAVGEVAGSVVGAAGSVVGGALSAAGSVIGGTITLAGGVVGGALGLAGGLVQGCAGLAAGSMLGLAQGYCMLPLMPLQLLGSLFGAGPQQCLNGCYQMGQPGMPPELAYGGAAQLANIQAAMIYSMQMSAMMQMMQQSQMAAFQAGRQEGLLEAGPRYRACAGF